MERVFEGLIIIVFLLVEEFGLLGDGLYSVRSCAYQESLPYL